MLNFAMINCNEQLEVASEGIKRILQSEQIPCYTVSSTENVFMDNEIWMSKIFFAFMTPLQLGGCEHPCCNFVIMILNRREEVRLWDNFRMHFVINLQPGEEPGFITDNMFWFQRVRNTLYSVFETRRGIRTKTFHWNGQMFMDIKSRVHETITRDFSSEVLRIGSGIVPPYSGVLTLPNGQLIVHGGIEVSI